jgi:hypothetical protein
LGLREKSRIAASESGIFLVMGSICCALLFCFAMDRTEHVSARYGEEKSPENNSISVAPTWMRQVA